jgi:predicted DNA-binding transcriptional regulator AlpA
MTSTTSEPVKGRRQLIDAQAVSEKIGCCERTVFRLADSGQMPWGIKVGALRRWDAQEIDEWIANGCPVVRKPASR